MTTCYPPPVIKIDTNPSEITCKVNPPAITLGENDAAILCAVNTPELTMCTYIPVLSPATGLIYQTGDEYGLTYGEGETDFLVYQT